MSIPSRPVAPWVPAPYLADNEQGDASRAVWANRRCGWCSATPAIICTSTSRTPRSQPG